MLTNHFDYLVIGAGPAGLQLGYCLEKANRNYLILEAGSTAGTFFQKFPRHGKLISINKVHTGYDAPEINLRWDWNSLLCDSEKLQFKHYSQDYFPTTQALTQYLQDFAEHYQLNIQYNCAVAKVNRAANGFQVTDSQGTFYTANRLIVAAGLSKPYTPDIPGIELAENYMQVSTNPEDFANQKVLIIGKGNSGFETADSLISHAAVIHIASPESIKLAWQSKYVGHLRAVNNNFLDTYQLKSQNGVLDATIRQITKQGQQYAVQLSYSHAHGEVEEILYDRVIVCTGFAFDASIFDVDCQPQCVINNRFPAQTSEWESVNVPDLYFAGVLMHMRDFKKKQSGFIHGFRYNIRALHRIFEKKYHGQPWPSLHIDASSASLTRKILERANSSSALWQQTGFICDLIVISDDGLTAQYFEEVPKDYVLNGGFGHLSHYYLVSLDFGQDVAQVADPFAINRVHKDDAAHASDSEFIHPIIRRYCGNTLMNEHHVIEDLASEWREAVHIDPLHKFMARNLLTYTAELKERVEAQRTPLAVH